MRHKIHVSFFCFDNEKNEMRLLGELEKVIPRLKLINEKCDFVISLLMLSDDDKQRFRRRCAMKVSNTESRNILNKHGANCRSFVADILLHVNMKKVTDDDVATWKRYIDTLNCDSESIQKLTQHIQDARQAIASEVAEATKERYCGTSSDYSDYSESTEESDDSE